MNDIEILTTLALFICIIFFAMGIIAIATVISIMFKKPEPISKFIKELK